MREIFTILTIILIGNFTTAQVTSYNIGDVVDNFTVTDTEGNTHTLYDITASGKYVYLDFFFTTCPPCQQTAHIFNEFYDKYGCNQGEIHALSLSTFETDSNAAIANYEQNYGGTTHHAPAAGGQGNSPAVVDNFGVGAFPTYAVVGPDNTLIASDIWPLSSVADFENIFPTGFNPEPMPCSTMNLQDFVKSQFSIYPSVSNGQLKVLLNEGNSSEIMIFNMEGKQVFINSYNTKTVDLNLNLVPGTYIMKVISNKITSTKKFIIK